MRLKDLREDNDVKQKQLAEYLNIKQNTYSQYENGKREIPIEMLWKLADFYNTSVDYIIGRTDNPTRFQIYVTTRNCEWFFLSLSLFLRKRQLPRQREPRIVVLFFKCYCFFTFCNDMSSVKSELVEKLNCRT